jgi:hypothetical protein
MEVIMRFVSSISSAYTGFGGREVKGLIDARAVRQHAREPNVEAATQQKQHGYSQETEQREAQQEERRKVSRRVSRQSVLVELRSGIDRRRHNLREGDIVEHIDEEA